MLTSIKQALLSSLPMSAEGMLILGGLVVHLATAVILRRALHSATNLVPALVIVLAIEALQMADAHGLSRLWAADGAKWSEILARHAHDVIVFLLAPVLVVVAARLTRR